MSEEYKKQTIIKLAVKLEEEGKLAIERINEQLTEDLKGYVTKQHIGQCLPKKFKDATKIHRGDEKTQLDETKLLIKVGESGFETTEQGIKDEVDRINRENEIDASNEFHKEFKEKLDSRGLPELNEEVFQELQRKIEEIDGLNLKIRGMHNEMLSSQHILSELSKHAGYYVKYDENFNIIDVKE